MIITNIKAAKRGLDKIVLEVDARTIAARDEMMARMIQLAQEEIQGERGVIGNKIKFVDGQAKRGAKIRGDDPAVSGQPPKNRTGNLRRSIRGQKFREGFGSYSAIVGPTIIYGRRVELGGGNWPEGVNFPYMKPAYDKFMKAGEFQTIFKKHLGG